jgi:hypothetical protein
MKSQATPAMTLPAARGWGDDLASQPPEKCQPCPALCWVTLGKTPAPAGQTGGKFASGASQFPAGCQPCRRFCQPTPAMTPALAGCDAGKPASDASQPPAICRATLGKTPAPAGKTGGKFASGAGKVLASASQCSAVCQPALPLCWEILASFPAKPVFPLGNKPFSRHAMTGIPAHSPKFPSKIAGKRIEFPSLQAVFPLTINPNTLCLLF